MTEPEPSANPKSQGNTITFSRWNEVVQSTRFPAYIYNATAYEGGANLNAYRRTWAGYDLGSIDAYGSRYTEFRDIRSTYMVKTVTSSQPATNTPTTATGYTFLSNTYNSSNQEGRLTLDPTNGVITPNINSAYIFWAGITISSIPSSMQAVFLQIQTDGVTVAEVNQNLDLIQNQSLTLRNQTFVAYKNTDFTILYTLLYTGSPPDYQISFGYTELVGKKSGCGAYSIL
jgi:hypothetical protein